MTSGYLSARLLPIAPFIIQSVLQLYTMDKLQKILLAATPIIAQPPPLPPVLQVATQAGIIQYLQDAGDTQKGESLLTKEWQEGQ